MTRVVDAGAGTLFAFRHDDVIEDETIAPNAAIAAAVLAHVVRAAGVVAGVGGLGSAAIPRAARDAFAALGEAAAAVEASEKEDALELELEQAMGIRRRPKRFVPDEASVTLSSGERYETSGDAYFSAARRLRSAALEAARTAAPLWSAPKSHETPKTKTPSSAFAVARLLVRGEDGHDKMRDRAVDANLGPERDLDDVEKALRVSSAPLAFALAVVSKASDSEAPVFDADAVVALRAAHALWLWTASCVALWRARRLVRATARPGVFDVEGVEAELRRRRRAASIVGRYWRAHAERFFANARAARPFSVDRALDVRK